jgi:hypothetical protein
MSISKPLKNYHYLLNQPKYRAEQGRPKLLRIEFCSEFTKVDFGYQTTDYYIRGGWVRMAADTFLRVQSTGEKFTLTRAENIPIAPVHHHFNTSKDWLYFSLYFPPIALKKGLFDIIEAEPGNENDFNYFDIELNIEKFIELM